MDLTVTRQPLYVGEVLLDSISEQPVECDALLPDSCPDIMRILRCEMTPAVSAARTDRRSVAADGHARVWVLYEASGGELSSAEYRVPFSGAFELRDEADGVNAVVTALPGHCSCRAVNSRRLDIRGSVSLHCTASAVREQMFISGGEGLGLQLKKERLAAVMPLGLCTRETEVRETAALPEGKPPAASLLRYGGTARVQDCKVLAGKALVKGQLELALLYFDSDGGLHRAALSLPASAVAELPGLEDGCRCSASQSIASLYADVGEDGGVLVEAAVLTCVRGYRDYEAEVCTDCFSTQHPCSFTTRRTCVTRLEGIEDSGFTARAEIPLPENADSISDVWCDVISCSPGSDENGSRADIRLRMTVLGKLGDGQWYCVEHLTDAVGRTACPGSEFLPGAVCTGCEWTMQGDTAAAGCELRLSGPVLSSENITVLDQVEADVDQPLKDAVKPGLYVYMRDDGELIWDIAKRYGTSPTMIAEENDADGAVLLIPVL